MTNATAAAEPDLSLSEHAYRSLRDQLIMLEIRPGDAINDSALAASLGIGRTPVREALKRLESDHLVVSYPRRGTFATRVDFTELADISEIRQLLEPLAARRAAQNATAPMRAKFRDLAASIAGSEPGNSDQHDLMRFDIKVHRQIYAAAGNAHLEDVLIRYDNLATRIWCLVLDKIPSVVGHITEHVKLLQAIADGDGELSAGLALEHVTNFEKTIRTAL
ncbi:MULTISPECIES: GntR family transcriptional regulator [Cryobacterium]|uniref:DNA-binding transcriptional regulator, GntR family n=1 Tax=Cryobacterium levicorallinum TaxID=995038 RepID=A0A1I2Z8R7_9MICO|nr:MULTISPECIES: GntR family transcriptional regulator [Cryobacterium]TFB82840.1 GntR family transcriptional regulator [Cryobacterium levicorallinum]TFD64060.1 GntR family transcriptional regulator [Cryobacterium sp. Hh38]GEP25721.1 GntR family transcriptional regulator [Cryobacterium levicorallinum]SFH34237.1 DNA-binding transcriptional regulator, GntR family [Cryobacterium levicorallinum]